jgi:Na+:H+ antiporter, NhaC family
MPAPAPSHRTAAPLTLVAALLPLLTMLAALLTGALADALTSESIVVAMLAAASVAGVVAVRRGATWLDIQQATADQVARVLPALLILLAIGMLIATWMLAGTIPYLVAWGVRLVQPEWLALTAFFAAALMSTCTGTSWGSAGTIGVAMMGTAAALDVSLPIVAGAVISGAYFGDKMSPLSDTTIVAALAAEVEVYAHIRHMIATAGPSFLVAAVVYALWGGAADVGDSAATASAFLEELERHVRLHAVVLLPPIVVLVAVWRRMPSVLAVALSSAVAAIIAVLLQGRSLHTVITAAVSGVRTTMLDSPSAASIYSADFARLVERGGMQSMTFTFVIVFAAFLLTGAMQVSGALDVLLARLLASVRSTFALVAATMTAGISVIGLTSHASVTMLVVGGLVRDAYRERALPPVLLSRSLEDSVTITEVLMPWTVSAVFMAGTLGVPTLAYAPWAVFCWMGPMMSLVLAAVGARRGR